MSLRGMRIGYRLGIGFGAILLALVGVLVFGSMLSANNRDKLITGVGGANAKVILAAKMKAAALESGIAMRNSGLQSDVAAMQKQQAVVKVKQKDYADARDKLAALGLSDAENKTMADIAAIDAQMAKPFKNALDQAADSGSREAALVHFVERVGADEADALRRALAELESKHRVTPPAGNSGTH